MKTIPLRTLLRDPKSVKKLTRGGHAVRITDGGVALWDLTPPAAQAGQDDEARGRLWEDHFDDLLSQPLVAKDMPSMDEVMEFSRAER